MLRSLLTRRRREDQRTDDFLHAIALSTRYRVDPDWALQAVPDEQPDVVRPLPLSLVRLLVQL